MDDGEASHDERNPKPVATFKVCQIGNGNVIAGVSVVTFVAFLCAKHCSGCVRTCTSTSSLDVLWGREEGLRNLMVVRSSLLQCRSNGQQIPSRSSLQCTVHDETEQLSRTEMKKWSCSTANEQDHCSKRWGVHICTGARRPCLKTELTTPNYSNHYKFYIYTS